MPGDLSGSPLVCLGFPRVTPHKRRSVYLPCLDVRNPYVSPPMVGRLDFTDVNTRLGVPREPA